MSLTAGLGPARLGQVSLHVRDVTRAERFYGETLGLPHVFTFGDLAFFDLDGTRLYLHRKDEGEWQPGSILYFVVDDIDAAYEELGRRGVSVDGTAATYLRPRGHGHRGMDGVLRRPQGRHPHAPGAAGTRGAN